jgi:hypothetical protein
MLLKTCRLSVVAVLALLLVPSLSLAQGTLADYQRAMTLRDRYENLAVNVPDQARWVANTQKLWYRKSVKGGHEFVLVDAGTRTKEPAFDHGKLAAALSAALGRTITPHELPFNQFTFVEGLSAIEFQVTGGQGQQGPPQPPWRCTLADYKCAREERAGRGGRGGRGGGGGLTGPVRPPSDINGAEPQKSPDGKYEALIKHNKDFELLVIPGAGHSSGGAYGDHKRYDFFTRHFLAATPPDWKQVEDVLKKAKATTTSPVE